MGLKLSLSQAVDRDPIGRPHIHPAIRNCRGDEFIARADLVLNKRRLIAVVEFLGKIGRIVSVQGGGKAIFHRPHDPAACAVRRKYSASPRIFESLAGLTGRSCLKFRIYQGESFDLIILCAVVQVAVEVCGGGIQSPGK